MLSENSTGIQWRTIYIIPEDSDSLVSCPVDNCYHLQDVLRNSSYFFDSYTTLELLPGMYYVTEKVGQLVLIGAENFTLKGSSPNVTITCQPGSSLGFTIIKSQGIVISNVQISHCSAELQLEDESNNTILTTYNSQLEEYLHYTDSSSCDTNAGSYPSRYVFLASFRNKKLAIYKTSILHSKGVGIFNIDSTELDISKSLLAYNQINCMIFVLGTTNTTFNMSQSQIEFGQIISHRYKFASGMNLFVYVLKQTHNIHLTNIVLKNNEGRSTYGNFYLVVSAQSGSHGHENIHVNIQITNMTSIQTSIVPPSPGYGLFIKYEIQLRKYERLSHSTCRFGYDTCSSYFDSHCFPVLFPNLSTWKKNILWPKSVDIVLENSYFIGSCVTISDSEIFTKGRGTWFWFGINDITINKSRCPTALSILNSDVNHHVRLSDLTISNSHNDILLVTTRSRNTNSKLILAGNTSFLTNQGSVSLLSGEIEFSGTVLISDNTAHKYESIFQISDSSRVYFEGETMFVNNTGKQGGAVSAYNSDLFFEGNNVSFIGNSANNGGAISLKEGAVINLNDGAHIIFQANVANRYGGAIYAEDAGFFVRRMVKCFIHYHGEDGYYVEFEKNIAGKAGAALFGGWIDVCGTEKGIMSSNTFDFKEENSVASNPTGVCICTNSTKNKCKTEAHITLFPGQTFVIEVYAVGQRFGIIPASVRAETARNNVIDQLQKLQDTENHCTKLKYTVRSSNRNETVKLSIDGQTMPQWLNETIPDEFAPSMIFIVLDNCPLGFEFDSRRKVCSCHPYLGTYGVQCNFTTFKVNRKAHQWIGLLNLTKTIVVHQHCPHNYCKPYALSLNLSTPDEQCSSSRSGILCGACQPGLSQVLGTSNCKECSNLWLLLVFAFTFAGVLLVAGLMMLNITVSTGTINGLIFCANIVRANTATFFPDKAGNTFLSWFIAWLNLDVGIETCFYNGLDAYVKTWLQFVFPLYIWFLVIVIIISSKYSQRAARLFGVNAVQVLATLFLLSYAKLLRVTITVFQLTQLVDNHKVWQYDGNIAYLGKWHALLMVVALFFFCALPPSIHPSPLWYSVASDHLSLQAFSVGQQAQATL